MGHYFLDIQYLEEVMMGEGGGDSSLAGVVQATCVLTNIGNQINDEISDQHSAGPIT